MRDADGRLIEAIVGVALAATLLLAAFSVIAQEPATTDRLIVRLATWADAPPAQAMPGARARDLSVAARTQLTPLRRMSGDALRALLQRTARAFPDGSCTPAACGAGIVDAGAAVRAASAPAPAPATEPAPVAVASTPVAAEIAPSGGGDSGGGCVVARGGAPDLVLPPLALWAASHLILRSRAAHGPRRTARA